MTKIFALFFAAIVAFSFPTFARDSAPLKVKAGVPDVAAALDEWKAAVESNDETKIMELYDKKAVMISTFVQHPMNKFDMIFNYYKKVVANPDVRVEIQEEYPRRYGDMAINSGMYTLSYTQEGEEVSIPARFSFVYQLQGGKWIIVDHHSSAVPLPKEVK